MNFSFWEYDTWFTNVDFTVVGSGIVGLNCAIRLRERFPKAKILILERGILPNGASTKNAGFACFGSLSEILDDLKSHSEEEMLELVKNRLEGLKLLRSTFGDETIGFHRFGGIELFVEDDEELFQKCQDQKDRINKMLRPLFKEEVFSIGKNSFGFKKVKEENIFNKFEGQLNTGKMMDALLQKAQSLGIKILNNTTVEEYSEGNRIAIKTNHFEFSSGNLFITTNGFASQLGLSGVKPARAQVLITEPIENLQVKGTFHLDEGYYYFRNINDRILLGGGRKLDPKTEETTFMEQTELIQNKLDDILHQVILPDREIRIDHRWSGIMGVGKQKKPIVQQISDNIYCGVRLGGMGVAIGSQVGKEVADLV